MSDATGAPSTTDYTLDGLGNRTVTTVDGAAEPATVNDLDQLTALGSDAFTYDAAGRLTSATGTAGTTTYAWTSQGELAQVATPSVTVDYVYDLAGNITTRTEDGAAVEFVYDSLTGLPRAVSASDGSWWVYVDGTPLAQHIPATSTTTGTTAYLHTDIRGDVRVATDATGTVTDTWTYTVDGELAARTGTTPVTVGWRGETHDTATGLIWLRARWYDPGTARFLSADPWHGNPANPASLNRYVYGNADPVNMHDPTGLTATSTAELAAVMRTIGQAVATAIRTVAQILRPFLRFYKQNWKWFLPYEVYAAANHVGLFDDGADSARDDDVIVWGEPQTQTGGTGNGGPGDGGPPSCQPLEGPEDGNQLSFTEGQELAKRLAEEKMAAMVSSGNAPWVLTVVVDLATGEPYYGFNGERVDVPESIRERLPDESAEFWDVDNCAEVNAHGNAARGNADYGNTAEWTVDQSGDFKVPCENCVTW